VRVRTARLALLSLGAGLVIVTAVAIGGSIRQPPLYDGVVVAEPYRYLAPGPGQAGNPGSINYVKPIENGTSPALGVATSENPPQAQLIAPPGGFVVSTGATLLRISIVPIAATPPDSIVGNAYRFAAMDQTGAAVPITEGAPPTIVLRAPAGATDVTLVHLVDGAWQALPTQEGGQPDAYLANVDSLGDLAVRGTVGQGPVAFDPRILFAALLVAAGSILALHLLTRPRQPAPPQATGQARRSPTPRKRRRRH